MARLDWRKNSIKLLSVFLALLLWVYVTNEQNPVSERVFNVSLQNVGMPSQMVASGLPSAVSIRVQSTRGQVSVLSPRDFKATIDLSRVGVGENDLPISVSAPPGVTVVQFNPQRVNVMVDRVVTKEVPVQVITRGIPAQNWASAKPVARPATVTAKGPQKVLNNLNEMEVVVDVQAAAGDVEKTVTLPVPRGGVTLTPPTVKVLVPIAQLPSKNVVIKPRIIGQPAEGFQVNNVKVFPDSAQVFAPAERLGQINQVQTAVLDIAGEKTTVTREVKLFSPPGASQIHPMSVQITVEIESIPAAEEPPAQSQNPPAGGTETNPENR